VQQERRPANFAVDVSNPQCVNEIYESHKSNVALSLDVLEHELFGSSRFHCSPRIARRDRDYSLAKEHQSLRKSFRAVHRRGNLKCLSTLCAFLLTDSWEHGWRRGFAHALAWAATVSSDSIGCRKEYRIARGLRY